MDEIEEHRRDGCLRSERDDLILSRFALLDAVDGIKCRHLAVERHAAQAVELAGEGQRDWVVDEIVAANSVTMEGEQVVVETADDGDEVTGVLNGVGVGRGFLLGWISTACSCRSVRHL